MFYDFGPKYFEHMFKHSYEDKPSVLIKIFGMFEKKYKNNSVYYIVMENLFYGMPSERTVYDLKGSEAKRWNRKGGSTLLDTNFIIDQNGEPLPVLKNNYGFFIFYSYSKEYISKAFILDSEFLEKCEVVDYSLLVVIDRERQILKLGIIDYLQ